MSFTPSEQKSLNTIQTRLGEVQSYLNTTKFPDSADVTGWFGYLAKLREIQGNISNEVSFLATLMAKRYLAENFEIGLYDAAAKAQGAPGLDIDLVTLDGKHIIGEIKTTVPYSGAKNDLGAQQKASFEKDFAKLNATSADFKYLFVTDQKTFEILNRKYATRIPGVTIILLLH